MDFFEDKFHFEQDPLDINWVRNRHLRSKLEIFDLINFEVFPESLYSVRVLFIQSGVGSY